MAVKGWGGVVCVAVVLAIAGGYWWWTGAERAIRKQIAAIARSLTVTANEGDLGPIARMATLRNALAPEIRVSVGPSPAGGSGAPLHWQLVDREAVLALATRRVPPPGGMTVDFVDVQVTVAGGRTEAEAHGTATITTRGATGQPTTDAIELRVEFTRVDGTWVVAAVRSEDPLTR